MTPSTAADQKQTLDIEKHECREDGNIIDGGDVSVQLDPAKETKLLAKLDLAFIPIIMLVYLSCFLDRSNIGMQRMLP